MIGKVGRIITDPIIGFGSALITEVAEAIEGVLVGVITLALWGGMVWLDYPYKTTARFIGAIILGGMIAALLGAVLIFVIKAIRYLLAFIFLLFVPLNIVFYKIETGIEIDIQEKPGKLKGWKEKELAYKSYIEQLKREKMEAEARYQQEKAANNQRKENQTNASQYNDYQEALALYMLTCPYTKEEVRKQRNRLLKTFHPDESSDNSRYAQKINKAYDILMKNAG